MKSRHNHPHTDLNERKIGKRKTRNLDVEEVALWQQVQKTVSPKSSRPQDLLHWLEDESALQPKSALDISAVTAKPVLPEKIRQFTAAPYSPPVSTPKFFSGAGHHIDDKTARKLVKGRVSIDNRIDLHGLTQDEAHRQLQFFLQRCHQAGNKMVLVITGKGKMSEGVLRQAVPTWLRQAQLSIYVSAFRQAHITHGGSGALYVKLRKQEIR